MLVVDLGKWMNKILIDWGIDAKVADRFDETIIAILMNSHCCRGGLSLSGNSGGRNEAVYPQETASLEYIADET